VRGPATDLGITRDIRPAVPVQQRRQPAQPAQQRRGLGGGLLGGLLGG
jgi:predicted lipid-binding transport protein (Tim44 family)